MSLTLGEKLRQAREAHGITISEIAEQTRISSLYLESIENNDYRVLPGGIFNKGFVKSYAKYVGLDEQEALRDYAQLISEQGENSEEVKRYQPEVLTDDRSRSSTLPTIILAVLILGLMVLGILALLRYYQDSQNQPVTNTTLNKPVNSNATTNASVSNTNTQPSVMTGDMKIEFKALANEVSVTYTTDGKQATKTVKPNEPLTITPQQSLKLNYYKGLAQNVQLVINGKPIALPSAPENPKRNSIELLITKENVGQIFQSGAITSEAPNTSVSNTAPRP